MKYLTALFLTALFSIFTLPAFSEDATQTNNAGNETSDNSASTPNKTIYTFVDESGRTIFTDDPTSMQTKNAKAVEAHTTNTLPAVAVPKKTKKKTKTSEKDSPIYNRLTLADINDEWDQMLHIDVSPELQEGHSFQAVVDGVATETTSQSSPMSPPEMEIGLPHTIQINIIDEDNEVLATSNVISIDIDQVGTMPGGFKRRAERVLRGEQMGIKTGR